MAGETSGLEFSEPLATAASFTTATSPVRAPVEPIQAPVEPIQAPVAPIKSECPEKSNIERQISKFQNHSNFGY